MLDVLLARRHLLGFALVANGCGRVGFDPIAPVEESFTWLMTADFNDPSGALTVYAVDSTTGALTQSAQGSVATRPNPTYSAVTPDGRFVYVPHETMANEISGFAIDPRDGRLTEVDGSPFSGPGELPLIAVMHPSGTALYVSNAQRIQCYRIDSSTGAIAPTGGPALIPDGFQMAIDPGGRFLYSASYATGDVHAFRIDGATCGFSAIGTIPSGSSGIHGIAVDPSGAYVVVSTTFDTAARVFEIDQTTGALVPGLGALTFMVNARWIAIAPSGDVVVITDSINGVHSFRFDAATGAMSEAPGSPLGTGAYWFIIIDDAGRFAYASRRGVSLDQLEIDHASGALIARSVVPAPGILAMVLFTTVGQSD